MYQVNIKDISLSFHTEQDVFSPSGADRGTLAMLSQVEFNKEDRVLDLGCGVGIVGILAAKLCGEEQITMCDISDKAIELSRINAELNQVSGVNIIKSNGLDDIEESEFTKILSNPPYHVDFSVPKNFIEKGYKKLAVDGVMYMVTKRKDWYKNKLISVFGGVKIQEIDGYYVFTARKTAIRKKTKEKNTNQQMSKKLQRKMASKSR